MLLPPRPPSPICSLAVLATVVSRLPIVVSQQRPGCRPGTYLDASTGSCLACIDGVNFMDEEYNTHPRCLDCSSCRGIMIPAVACSAARDTECRCPNGFTTTIEGLCRPVNPGADDSTSLTDSRSRTISVLSTGSDSDSQRSTEAKHSSVEAAAIGSIDAKLDKLISYVVSLLTLFVLFITVYLCLVIRTFYRCKKPRDGSPHQTDDSQYHTTAVTNAPEPATATHADDYKDNNQGENGALLKTPETVRTDSPDGFNCTSAYRRTISVPEAVISTRR